MPFYAVLMATRQATQDWLRFVDQLSKTDYCPLEDNRRRVDDSGGQRPDRRVDSPDWPAKALAWGKRIQIRGLPQDCRVALLPVAVSTRRTDGVAIGDPAWHAAEATGQACGGFRWPIGPPRREGKQLTGVERCPCRRARIQRSPIGCAFPVWIGLKEVAAQTGRSVYQLKRGLLDDCLIRQLKNPSLKRRLASVLS